MERFTSSATDAVVISLVSLVSPMAFCCCCLSCVLLLFFGYYFFRTNSTDDGISLNLADADMGSISLQTSRLTLFYAKIGFPLFSVR